LPQASPDLQLASPVASHSRPEGPSEASSFLGLPSLSSLLVEIREKLTESLRLYSQWRRPIIIGLISRFVTLAGIVYMAFTNPFFPDVNDMNELLTLGLFYMFSGKCPYGQTYVLSALGNEPREWYVQDFLNYGPMNLLIHVPAMLYPVRFFGAGYMDFQPSFMALHWFFDFLLFDRLMRMGHRKGAMLVWWNPVMLSMDLVTHMSVPLFLIFMGYEKWEDPVQSVFWLGVGAATYQYIGLLLLFAVAYHLRRNFWKVVAGLIPPVVVVGAFQLWAMLEGRPWALLHDLLLEQFNRPYEPWSEHTLSWWSWTGSIPAIIYNVFGTDFVTDWTGGLIRLSTVMNAVALGAAVVMLIHLIWKPNRRRSLIYSVVAMGLVLLGSPSGIWHHNFIIIFPFFFMAKDLHILLWSDTIQNLARNLNKRMNKV